MSGRSERKRARRPRSPARLAGPRLLGGPRAQALVLALLAFALYANTIPHGYVLDDDIATRRNALVQRGVAGWPGIFGHGYLYGFNGANDQSYRPLTLATTALEVQLFGNRPAVHHLVNVLLFTLAVLLLFALLRALRVPRPPGAGSAVERALALFPFVAALLFAAHPIHTEVVANIKSRDEILSFVFATLALLAVLRTDARRPWRPSVLGAALFLLAALSKETGLATLALVPLTLWFFRPAGLRRVALATLPSAVAAALYFAIRASVMSRMVYGAGIQDVINNSLQAAHGPGEWLASRVAVLGRYAVLLVFPHPLSYDYSYAQVPLVGPADPRFLASLALYLALAAFALWGLRSRHPVAYGAWVYLVLLALVSNLLTPVGTTMAERLLFGSSAGFCLALGWLLARAIALRPGLAGSGLGLVLALYAGRTVTRNRDWADPGVLFASGLRTAPRSARVHDHYASWLRERGEALPASDPARAPLLRRAAASYREALRILPSYAEARYNLGVTWHDLGEADSARASYERTLADDSTFLAALNNLGVLRLAARDYDGAAALWSRLLRLDPGNADARFNLAAAAFNRAGELSAAGEADRAREHYASAARWLEEAYAAAPARPGLVDVLVRAYAALGDSASARRWSRRLPGATP